MNNFVENVVLFMEASLMLLNEKEVDLLYTKHYALGNCTDDKYSTSFAAMEIFKVISLKQNIRP